jgi:cysteine desulfurase/selenocysteine lyase
MIEHVCLTQGAKYKGMPDRFEAGTPNVAGCIGLAAALTYLEGLGWQHLERYEQQLLAYAHERLLEVPGLKLIGTATPKVPVAAFQLGYIHPHDVAGILGASNIAIRAGYHCAQPLIEHLAVPALSRISLAFYNTTQEIDAACEALCKVAKLLG